MFVSRSMWEPVCYVMTVCGRWCECVKGRCFAVRAPELWSDSPEEIRSAESGAGFPSQICSEFKGYLQNINKTQLQNNCVFRWVMSCSKKVISRSMFSVLAGLFPLHHFWKPLSLVSAWRSRLKIPPLRSHVPCHVMWLFDVCHVTCEYRKSASNPVLWK